MSMKEVLLGIACGVLLCKSYDVAYKKGLADADEAEKILSRMVSAGQENVENEEES